MSRIPFGRRDQNPSGYALHKSNNGLVGATVCMTPPRDTLSSYDGSFQPNFHVEVFLLRRPKLQLAMMSVSYATHISGWMRDFYTASSHLSHPSMSVLIAIGSLVKASGQIAGASVEWSIVEGAPHIVADGNVKSYGFSHVPARPCSA